MRSKLAGPVASLLLLMGSAPVIAGELPFSAPNTHSARENVKVLHRAAHALYGCAPDAARISHLWLFPTDDSNTVFAEYTVNPNGLGGAAAEHVVVLTLRGDRILAVRDLTEAVADSTEEARASRGVRPASAGAAPDWTSKIGTGSAAAANSGSKMPQPLLARVASPLAIPARTGRMER